MKSQTQIKKGCGKPTDKLSGEYSSIKTGSVPLYWRCGENPNPSCRLCSSCQSLLAQSQEFVGNINNLNNEFLKKELSPEQLLAVQYFIEELKSQITGEENCPTA